MDYAFLLDGIRWHADYTSHSAGFFDWIRAFTIKQTNLKREAIKMRLPQGSFQGNILEYFTEERLVNSKLQFSTFGQFSESPI